MPGLVPDACSHGLFPDGHSGCDAKIVLIGEAPGKFEDEQGAPFVGESGRRLNEWWSEVGLHRSQFYITNVIRRRPPNNVIEAVGRKEIERGNYELFGRLSKLAAPTLIVPTGNTSLNALMGDTLESGAKSLRITDWRGSILLCRAGERNVKCIPTIHPAATFRQPILTKFCKADWKRIAGDWQFPELRHPEYHHIIDPTQDQIERFESEAKAIWSHAWDTGSPPPAMAVDVENSMFTQGDRKFFKELTCVGFSFDPSFSLTISTLPQDYITREGLRYAWEAIARLCALPIPKVLQNGLTDQYKLQLYDIPLNNYRWDLMEMDHALDPNDGGDTEKGSEEASKEKTFKMEMRSLKIMQSLYTRAPFHKLEGKTFDRAKQLIYNGKDDCVERELYGVYWAKLKSAGLL